MKAYLIDPYEQSVSEVEYNGDYNQIYKLIDATTFDVARIADGDSIYIDDDGLSKDWQEFFMHEDYGNPLAGKGLVLGCNDEGDSTEPACTLEQLREQVSFGFPMRLNNSVLWIRKEMV